MAHVEDRWTRPSGEVDARGREKRVHTDRYGSGLRYVAQWTEGANRRSRSFRTKDAADAHLADVAKGKRDGTHVATNKLTVSEYAHDWMNAQLHQRDSTRAAMQSRWAHNVEPLLGHLRLRDVTRRHIENAVQQWHTDNAPATTRAVFTYCKAVFEGAVRDRLIPTNPCVGVKLPEIRRGKVTPLTVEQVWDVANRVNPRLQGLILLAAATGMRSAELRGLTTDRIITRNGRTSIRVDRQLTSTTPTWDETKTARGSRSITIDPHTVNVLTYHQYRVPPHPTGLLFTGEGGGPLNAATVSDQLRDIGNTLHLQDRFGLHAFRHFHASLLIRAGLSPTAVAARLGNNPTLVLAVYSHLWMDDDDRSRDAIAAGLFG